MTVRRMRVTCWISKATRAKANARSRAPIRKHSPRRAHREICQLILIAFPRHQRFVDSPVLRYTYIVCLAIYATCNR